MAKAQYIIKQVGGDSTWYVQQVTDIRFTDKRESALVMTYSEALEVVPVLMTMQRVSSGSYAPVFAFECVSKGSMS